MVKVVVTSRSNKHHFSFVGELGNGRTRDTPNANPTAAFLLLLSGVVVELPPMPVGVLTAPGDAGVGTTEARDNLNGDAANGDEESEDALVGGAAASGLLANGVVNAAIRRAAGVAKPPVPRARLAPLTRREFRYDKATARRSGRVSLARGGRSVRLSGGWSRRNGEGGRSPPPNDVSELPNENLRGSVALAVTLPWLLPAPPMEESELPNENFRESVLAAGGVNAGAPSPSVERDDVDGAAPTALSAVEDGLADSHAIHLSYVASLTMAHREHFH
ncbi:hypothetical protein BZG36_05479 [Bifiguratus adelaidae]|uniref:Uncharacterized protein n=1 Tax=Bifiguratus adelaidae TaxID=1938954 RepID=A0A261XTY4_9FUNG|nr:hypothetical protein BZG36_05479 [Bifiguratus adelaidae]